MSNDDSQSTKARAQETAGTAQQRAGEVAGSAKEQAAGVAGTAKEQAAGVAGSAKEQAADVAGTAKEQAATVVAEAKDQAVGLLDQLRQQVDEQTGTQRDRLAAFLRQAGQELRQMGDASEGSGAATQLVRQAGDRASAWGSTLEAHEPQELLEQLRRYARRRPGAFLLGALAAGVVAGRVTRGASAASGRTGDTAVGARGSRELEPLATAPVTTAGATTPAPLGGVGPGTAPGTGSAVGAGVGTGVAAHDVDPTVSRFGENPDEDLVPHHLRSDVPSVSDAPSHGYRP
ncbi:hypothetical protein [Kineococcus sp. SYSU DK004]|uniref:hypothetical protein n=1 Tax=Kineococcus sp. SYSU DK004 TaxID=3383125 RepID=UPI003D7D2FAE